MHGQQPPASHPYGPPPPYPYRDPHDYYVVGQDDQPAYVHRDERDNPTAITGFSFGICALGLHVTSFGIAFLATIPCAIVGIVAGRRGMDAVDRGVATKHRRYAKAGFVVGIVTLVLASLTAATFILGAIFPDEFGEENNEFRAIPGVWLALAILGAR
jgi:hypothetical protein